MLDAAVLSGSRSPWQFFWQTTGNDREPMLLAAGGMKDLRIYDASIGEVPYLKITWDDSASSWISLPRYDLEAARESAAKANTVAAKWADPGSAKVEAESPAETALPLVGSSMDPNGFRYARRIVAVKSGLNDCRRARPFWRTAEFRICGFRESMENKLLV